MKRLLTRVFMGKRVRAWLKCVFWRPRVSVILTFYSNRIESVVQRHMYDALWAFYLRQRIAYLRLCQSSLVQKRCLAISKLEHGIIKPWQIRNVSFLPLCCCTKHNQRGAKLHPAGHVSLQEGTPLLFPILALWEGREGTFQHEHFHLCGEWYAHH